LGIFKLINQSVIPLISSTKCGYFSTKKRALLLCFEAALMLSILWKALYKYTWLDVKPWSRWTTAAEDTQRLQFTQAHQKLGLMSLNFCCNI